jgi:hypothetical protein
LLRKKNKKDRVIRVKCLKGGTIPLKKLRTAILKVKKENDSSV